jgi:hypothetical protein
VTELIRIADEDGTTELTTRSGSDHTLADWAGPDGESVDTAAIAGVLAALATTCSDLHGMGIVHGRIEPQRVAIPITGQPILTGFEAAGPIGTIPLPADPTLPPFCDPAAGPGRPLQPATDVFGLGALLEHLLERHQPSRGDADRGARRRLRRLARTATAESQERRPDAAALAASILEAAPAAHLPGDDVAATPAPPPPGSVPLRLQRPAADLGPPRTGRSARWAGVAAAVLVVLVGGVFALGRNRPAATSESAQVSKPAAQAPTTPVPSTMGSIVSAPASLPPSTVAVAPPTTSTTSPPTVPTAPTLVPDPTYLDFDGVRYRIDGGQRRFAIGDWDCDGSATLATLDPSTGALTFFEEWPQAGSTRAAPADQVPGAIDLRAEPIGGCHHLTIVHADGTDTYERIGDPP